MRAYLLAAVCGLVLGCSGGAFTSSNDSLSSDGGTGAVAAGGGGSDPGLGGSSTGANGGDVASAGSQVNGGSGSVGGDPGVSGGPPIDPGAGGAPAEPGPDTSCPTSPPQSGGACADGLTCTYGSDVRLECRQRATCQNGSWTTEEPACKQLRACSGDLKPGDTCDAGSAACVKNGAQYCACSACVGTLCGTEATWHCTSESGSSRCPKLAPNQGEACSQETSCDYGVCGLPQAGAVRAVCDGHSWSYESVPCPL